MLMHTKSILTTSDSISFLDTFTTNFKLLILQLYDLSCIFCHTYYRLSEGLPLYWLLRQFIDKIYRMYFPSWSTRDFDVGHKLGWKFIQQNIRNVWMTCCLFHALTCSICKSSLCRIASLIRLLSAPPGLNSGSPSPTPIVALWGSTMLL